MVRSEHTSGAQETLWAEEDTPLTSRRVDRTKGIDQPAREPFHPPATPSETFAKIRNFLAGRHVGATRDSALLDQVLLCLFAKLYLNQIGVNGSATESLRDRYTAALRKLKGLLPDSLPHVTLTLDVDSLRFVDVHLELLDLQRNGADLVGDAYQCFCGSEMRGQEGQFFTPVVAINLLVKVIDPQPGERIIDPAAGAGGFLFAAANHLLSKGAKRYHVAQSLFGIEKDDHLARLARIRLSLVTLQRSRVVAGDSLAWSTGDPDAFMVRMRSGDFDVVLTNPPFGTKIVSASDAVRKQFALAHRWAMHAGNDRLEPSDELMPSTPPQVLFVERCLSLVRPGGRVGMVVPESILSGKNYRSVVEFITRAAKINAVIGMPEALFKTSGKGGTHTKTALICLEKVSAKPRKPYAIFMAEAQWCGHDSRGRKVPKDDTVAIIAQMKAWQQSKTLQPSAGGYIVDSGNLRPGILAPRAYDPGIQPLLRDLEGSHQLVRFGDLASAGALSITTGDEVGKLAYGTGDVPFVRTSDLSNWEIKVDPKHAVSREVYESLREKQDVQPGDILMVRDGTYLIGTCAIVTKYDTEVVLQSHIYKIRVHSNPLFDPHILLAVLSSPLVQRQIKSHSQTQDIINSLGDRINDLILPIPRDELVRQEISQQVRQVIEDRVEARELSREVMEAVGRPRAFPTQSK
jgi:type I restriction enzyme M protein